MIKRLLFYWYVNEEDFINRFSLLHLYSLGLYQHNFDKKTFLLSMDNPDNSIIRDYTEKMISAVVPDAEFEIVKNNPDYASEAYWFKTGFIPNMEKYKDEVVFWCHGKGKGGLKYTEKTDLYIWISLLWYLNFSDPKTLPAFISDDYAYMMGTMLYPIPAWPFSMWHYHGGFYWMKPERIYSYIKENDMDLSPMLNCDTWHKRYIAEGFPGAIFPTGDHCLSMNDLYSCDSHSSHRDYMKKNCADMDNFMSLYGQFINS